MPDFYRDVRVGDADLGVWYYITAGARPTRDDPGYPAEIEIVSIQHKSVEMIELLSESTIQQIVDEVAEDAAEVLQDYIDEARCGLH